MADSLNTPTSPEIRSISAICRDWRISRARCLLECEEAPDDESVDMAAQREAERAAALLDEIDEATPESITEISDIVSLAVKLLQDGSDREVIVRVLRRVFWAPVEVKRPSAKVQS